MHIEHIEHAPCAASRQGECDLVGSIVRECERLSMLDRS